MLRQTFLHIPGVGKTTERRLWSQGCGCWADLLATPTLYSVGSASKKLARRHLELSDEALDRREHQFFRSSLGMRNAWRAFPEFQDRCVYLDIETDGGMSEECVTTIGLYDGKTYQCLMKGVDLENFRDIISHYSLIVTFFGGGFDIPVLEKRFLGLRFDQIHIDLCPLMRQLGYRGGLKSIEKQLGIERSPETEGLTGYDAVLLWRKYVRYHDEAALDRLIAYNREDVVNLERIAMHAYEGLKAELMGEFAEPRQRVLL